MLRTKIAAGLLLLSLSLINLGEDSKSENTISLPLMDRSEGASPLAINGMLWLARRLKDGKLLTSEDTEVTARNISNKPIVTLVTLITGGSTKSTQQFEFFFGRELLEPGQTLAIAHKQGLWHGWSESPTSATELPPVETIAEIRVLFVQFADGSIFGDREKAREYQGIRQKTWLLLAELKKLYLNRGEAEFAKALENQVQSDLIDLTLRTLKETRQSRGSAAAFEKLDSMLATADKRELEMGSAAFGEWMAASR